MHKHEAIVDESHYLTFNRQLKQGVYVVNWGCSIHETLAFADFDTAMK